MPAQNDPAGFVAVPAPLGSPQPLAQLAKLAVSNPAPRAVRVVCDLLITDTGDRLVTDTGLAFCIGPPIRPLPP